MSIPNPELIPIIQYQIAVLDKLAEIHGDGLHHVKPHGALYNHAYIDTAVSQGIVNAFKPWNAHSFLYVQYGSALAKYATDQGINFKLEGFADRRYASDLNLINRSNANALHQNIDEMIRQVINMVKNNKVITSDGSKTIEVQTICIHGDHPNAIEIAKELVQSLNQEGIVIK